MSASISKEKYLELISRISTLEAKLELLETKNSKKYYTMNEFCELTGYSKFTIYKKLKFLKQDTHYFYSKGNGSKLLFDESAVDFLIKGEYKNGESIPKTRQSLCLGKLFGRKKEV